MNKVRLGIIGCGGMSQYHGRVLAKGNFDIEIAALCDTQPNNLAKYQQDILDPLNQKPPAFADYRTMLQKVALDGVLIVTPHSQHFEQATAALDAGCHVLVEKPMVVKTEHARQLIAHAKKVNRTVSVAFPGPYTPEFQYIRALMQRGEL